jgi:hypothetical protein
LVIAVYRLRVKNWETLQQAWHIICTLHRPCCARRMGLFRNGGDASQGLVLIEYANLDALLEPATWQELLAQCLDLDSIKEDTWEDIECSFWPDQMSSPSP